MISLVAKGQSPPESWGAPLACSAARTNQRRVWALELTWFQWIQGCKVCFPSPSWSRCQTLPMKFTIQHFHQWDKAPPNVVQVIHQIQELAPPRHSDQFNMSFYFLKKINGFLVEFRKKQEWSNRNYPQKSQDKFKITFWTAIRRPCKTCNRFNPSAEFPWRPPRIHQRCQLRS